MKKLKSLLKNKLVFGILLIAAVSVLGFSGVRTSRAALTYLSENYVAQVATDKIGITLVENGSDIAWRNSKGGADWDESGKELLTEMVAEGESVQFGRVYPEKLAVRNTGSIPEYVRVIVTKYWVDEKGKRTELSPSYIELNLLTNGWVIDESVSTPERTVLYYTSPLGVEETTALFADTLKINEALAAKVTQTTTKGEDGSTTVTTTFDYDGVEFRVEAEADGVQTHNAADAIKSAWGVDVTIGADGSLRLN